MIPINVLSLFDGISCGRVALERAGVPVANYYASEIDKYAIKVSQSNYPDIMQLGDVRNIRSCDLPEIDLLIGGSPCQGFSFAGKQLNFEDPRSSLFFEYVRLLNELSPKYFLLENVVMKKGYQDIISEQIGVRPIMINSSLVSAQNRKRLYWTNIPNITQPEDKNIKLNDIIDNNFYSTREKSYCIDANYGKGTNFRRYFFCGSRQLILEKGYTPSLMNKENANLIMKNDGNRWRKLSAIECEVLQTLPPDYTYGIPNTQRYKCIGNGWTIDIVDHFFKRLPTIQ